MLMLDQKCFRTTAGSISAPARKVRIMAPAPARKLTQGVISSLAGVPSSEPTQGMTFPATAPTISSMRATEMAARMEMRVASSARPTQSAAINHVDSDITILLPTRISRSHQPDRRLYGGLHPHGPASIADACCGGKPNLSLSMDGSAVGLQWRIRFFPGCPNYPLTLPDGLGSLSHFPSLGKVRPCCDCGFGIADCTGCDGFRSAIIPLRSIATG